MFLYIIIDVENLKYKLHAIVNIFEQFYLLLYFRTNMFTFSTFFSFYFYLNGAIILINRIIIIIIIA